MGWGGGGGGGVGGSMTFGCHPADLFLGCTMLQVLIYIELNVYCRYVKLDQIGLHTHND